MTPAPTPVPASATADHAVHTKASGSPWRTLIRDPRSWVGAVGIALISAVALAGPALAPWPVTEFVGRSFAPPGPDAPLGTDILGHDVLSLALSGGATFLAQGIGGAALAMGAGLLFGILAAITAGPARTILGFAMDSTVIVPQILMSLVIVAAFGAAPATLVVAVGCGQTMLTARVVRAAALRVAHEDYYLAALAAGENLGQRLFAEILPGIAPTVLVELGVRLTTSFVAIASLSFLGFGGAGVEWGRMIHDNQGGLAIQPWATLTPVALIAIFLLSVHLLRDGVARALAAAMRR
jgi:peptide/nickel transport system permease protein